MLEQTIEALRKHDGVHDWLVRHLRKTSTQLYVIGSSPESRRTVHSQQLVATVMNDHLLAKGGEGSARGQAEVTILPSDLPRLSEKLSEAVSMAGLTDNPPYGLAGPAKCPCVDLADAEMQSGPQDVAGQLVEQLTHALAGEKGVRLSSAEVFVEERHVRIRNSRGVDGSQVGTELFELTLLASDASEEMESNVAFTRRRAADLDVPALTRRYAQHARDAILAGTPKTGAFPVVVSGEALAELLMSEHYSPLILRSSAQAKYQRVSTWEVGQNVLGVGTGGDPFTVYSNAVLPFGTHSGSFDEEGLPGQRLPIVENGVLTRFWATQRYAEYLGVPATGEFGNLEITAGGYPLDALLDDQGPLYHIVAFSAMTPDPLTGDFVGEIRLGYELWKGQTRPIRGGSISGNLFDVLASAHLSRETVFLGDYIGPQAMRFAQVTVAGA
jgi:predicted Zn-dependent protease